MLNLFIACCRSLGMIVKLDELCRVLETTVIFVAIGLIVFAIAFLIVVLSPRFRSRRRSRTTKTFRWRSLSAR